jgi:hypothetical protein
MQVYRLLEYSHLVTDIRQSQRPPDTTVGEASKRKKMRDFATDATGGAGIAPDDQDARVIDTDNPPLSTNSKQKRPGQSARRRLKSKTQKTGTERQTYK